MLGDTPKELYADSYMPPKASQMVQCGSSPAREHAHGQSLSTWTGPTGGSLVHAWSVIFIIGASG